MVVALVSWSLFRKVVSWGMIVFESSVNFTNYTDASGYYTEIFAQTEIII